MKTLHLLLPLSLALAVPGCVKAAADDDTTDDDTSGGDDDSGDDDDTKADPADDAGVRSLDAGADGSNDDDTGSDVDPSAADATDGGGVGDATDAGTPDDDTDDAGTPDNVADDMDGGSTEGDLSVSCEQFVQTKLAGVPVPEAPDALSPTPLPTFSAKGSPVRESCPFTESALMPLDVGEAELFEPDATVGVLSDPETGLDLFVLTVTGDFACGSAGCGVYVYVDAGNGYELAGRVTAQEFSGTMHFGDVLSLIFWQRGEDGPDSFPFVYQIDTSGPSPQLVYFGPLAG